jgi:hypothetical protein
MSPLQTHDHDAAGRRNIHNGNTLPRATAENSTDTADAPTLPPPHWWNDTTGCMIHRNSTSTMHGPWLRIGRVPHTRTWYVRPAPATRPTICRYALKLQGAVFVMSARRCCVRAAADIHGGRMTPHTNWSASTTRWRRTAKSKQRWWCAVRDRAPATVTLTIEAVHGL